MKWWRYLFSELRHNSRFSLLFVINLSLGLSGFVTLQSFKGAIETALSGRSKAVLGADMGISARRPLAEKELQLSGESLPNNLKFTDSVELFSMISASDGRSRLVQVKVVDQKFPFYGTITLESGETVSPTQAFPVRETPETWIYPELVRQLKVKKGDSIKLGATRFQVAGVIKDDAAAGLSTSMAPRIYINRAELAKTQLIREGSIAWHSRLYAIPGASDLELTQWRDQIFAGLDSPEVRVYTHNNVSEQMATLISRLNDFLGLASLVTLFLAAVGSAFLFRSYLRQRTRSIAVLLSLGASRGLAFRFYLTQALALGLASFLGAVVISQILLPSLIALSKDIVPMDLQVSLTWPTLFYGLVVGGLGTFCLCLPVLASLYDVKASLLLSGRPVSGQGGSRLALVSLLPGLILFFALAVALSRSYMVGGLFSGLLLLSSLFLSFCAVLVFGSLNRWAASGSLAWKWALRDLVRQRVAAVSAFLAIGIGAILLNLIPQVQQSLAAELERPEDSKLPSLFLFDVQDEQVSEVEKVLASQNLQWDQISPMIRSRLMKVNGQDFDKGKGLQENFSREKEREMRFRNRGFNLTYKEKLSESETLVDGEDFSGTYDPAGDALPEISLEKRFAERLGLKMGDILEFDIEGVPVEGKVINIRQVRWTSFQPNFFVQFQLGVLEEAPKTYIATLPSLSLDRKNQVQDLLVESSPNISMVDVSRIVKTISDIMNQMAWILQAMSLLSLLAGLIVIFSIANHQSQEKRFQIALLKSLGAGFPVIRQSVTLQFLVSGGLALVIGALLSFGFSFVLSSLLFDSSWAVNFWVPILTVIVGLITIYGVSRLAVRRALGTTARALLNASSSESSSL